MVLAELKLIPIKRSPPIIRSRRNNCNKYFEHVEQAYIKLTQSYPSVLKFSYFSALRFGMVVADYCPEVYMPTAIAKTNPPESTPTKTPAVVRLDQQTWPLKIYTLGRFALVRGGVPHQFSGKVPRKPLELLKALVAFGGRGVSEDQLIDQLWSHAEADDAIHSLSSALHRLRQLLGGAHFILRQDRRITLDSSFCWVDAWAFERLSKQAQCNMQSEESEQPSALHTAQEAIAHYTGHFLPADMDQQWSISMRERLRDKMRSLVTMVGLHWELATDWQTALATYRKGLETDDLYEEFYQRQMICCCRLGNHGEVASIYQRCRSTLAMFGFKPSPRTAAVYQEAISPDE